MAQALEEQRRQPDLSQLEFEDRLALLRIRVSAGRLADGAPQAQWFRQELQQDFGDAPASVAAAAFQTGSRRGASAAFYLHQLGHPLLLASDTPSSPTYAHQPGYGTYLEIQAMAAAGISLQAIFEAATINNARWLKLEHDFGTVSKGKVANLLLLKENPLQHSRNWDSIEQVIVHGVALPRASLAASSD